MHFKFQKSTLPKMRGVFSFVFHQPNFLPHSDQSYSVKFYDIIHLPASVFAELLMVTLRVEILQIGITFLIVCDASMKC